MGHDFTREHDVMRAISHSSWDLTRGDYLRHLMGHGPAWAQLATPSAHPHAKAPNHEAAFWKAHVSDFEKRISQSSQNLTDGTTDPGRFHLES